MWKSLKEYITSFGYWGWVVLVGILGAVTGLVLNVTGVIGLPLWVWLTLIGITLLTAPFLSYHSLRKKRDDLQAQLNPLPTNGVVVLKQAPTLFIEIQDIDFGLSGDPKYQGYPPLNPEEPKTRWIRLGMIFKGNVFIETLELVISGKAPIPAYEWKPGQAAYYYYFRIPDWVKSREERTIQVQVFANGIKWGSPEKSINFPML